MKEIYRAALVKDGVVINTIIADEDFAIVGHLVVRSDSAEIGDLFDGAAFTKPPTQPES